ncbi:MAG: diaminopimelate decarboxylase [Phycisphaerae bacterium]|nr:diaminopimelate decarboxylase [Phycisphaerae bacterium]MCZ2400238.1 diaminopimelate decarboxylase [Phycisphaerae bacterium]NUQ50793.1 diaminopimelate decarboxylase [Phycisphaerae bacterium]
MDRFEYRDGRLWCEETPAATLAERFGTPLYVYSQDTLLTHYDRVQAAFAELDPLICYSIKCCQNIHLLRLLAQRGSGFDVVSGGELHRARLAGAEPSRIVFAGVGKTDQELTEALQAAVGWLNVESESEMEQLSRIAEALDLQPRAALRVNPDVDPKTHVYTTTGKRETKFGVDLERAAAVFQRYGLRAGQNMRGRVRLTGLHLHIGSPVNDPQPYAESIGRALELIRTLRGSGFMIDTLDVGGGFGAFYVGGEAPAASEYARVIVPLLKDQSLRVILEPGRSIAANAGILLTRVLHTKSSGARRFVIVDASMNELIRPALYDAYHFIWPAEAAGCSPVSRGVQQPHAGLTPSDVVGPICESGDFLAKARPLPGLRRGDLLAVFTAGAYAMTMASQYNSRPRAAEVLVAGAEARLVRRRETYDDLVRAELEPGAEAGA